MQKKTMYISILAVALLVGATGGTAFSAFQANAASDNPATPATAAVQSDSSNARTSTSGPIDPLKGGHIGSNGTKEELLTGDTAEKVKAAALAQVSGGTVQRVENDAEGAVYEAHMTKADGSHVTVKLDSNFKVTGVETGGPGRK